MRPSHRRLGPLDSRFEQGRYLGPMDGSNTVLVGTASGVVKARTIKRSPPGERSNGSLLDEAHGSELDQMHWNTMAVELWPELLCWCQNFDKCDERHCAEPISSSLATQTIALGVPTQELVSEQCRSSMEAILVTTTEGHMRLERVRDRFAQFAEEPSVMESPRKRHRPESEGWPPASTALESGVYQEGGSAGSGSPLPSNLSEIRNSRPT